MMHTLEITIQHATADGLCRIVIEQIRPGESLPAYSIGQLQLDLTNLRMQGPPRDYGRVLGQALFRDAVRDAFIRARAVSADRLRVLLFVEDESLRTLRWELLCAPLDGEWDFLALDQRILFSLYLPSPAERYFPPIGRRDLRAVALVASPKDLEHYRLAPFDTAAAASNVRAAFGEIPCDVLAFSEGAVGPPTLDALCERLTAEYYTLLHIVCHGGLRRDTRETVLYLADAANQTAPADATNLIERLQRLTGRGLPHFTFLASCESASPEAEGALGGLAQRLVRNLGMPAVLAMTDRVSIETAQALTTAFYRQLRAHGEVDRALVEARAGLAGRPDIIVPALYSRLGGRPLFSDTLDRPLTSQEIAFGLDSLDRLLSERAPVLRPQFETHAAVLRGTLGADPAVLSQAARYERSHALDEIALLASETLDLSFNALALGTEPPAYDVRCPFRGLEPFRSEDRAFFFGRETLVARLQARLADHPFLAVLGPSGCGKSSLVLAGLASALRTAEPDVKIVELTPGSDPPASLEASLAQAMQEGGQAVGAALDQRAVVLIVDQFEELFTLCSDTSKRKTFLDRLLALAPSARIVIVLRADFLGECTPYPALKELVQTHQELIASMDSAELRRAIELQAAATGLRFEAELITSMLEDTRDEPGAMPLLQHTLRELWERRHGRWLRTHEYHAIGGVRRAIAHTADSVYTALGDDERKRMRAVFLRLTRSDIQAAPGAPRRDTSRRVRRQDLVPAGADPAATVVLVNRLTDARLVVTSVNAATGQEEVEVAHEALIRYWPRLRDWLDEDAEALRINQQVIDRAQEWERLERDRDSLYRGRQLDEAAAWAERHGEMMNALEREFLDASLALRRIKRTLLRAGIALLVVAVPLLFAWVRIDLIASWVAAVLVKTTVPPAPKLPGDVRIGYSAPAACASGRHIEEGLQDVRRRVATLSQYPVTVTLVAAPQPQGDAVLAQISWTCAAAPGQVLSVTAAFTTTSPYPIDLLQEPAQVTLATNDADEAVAFAQASMLYALGQYELAHSMLVTSTSNLRKESRADLHWLWGNIQLRRENWPGALGAYARAYDGVDKDSPQAAQLLANQALARLYLALTSDYTQDIRTCGALGGEEVEQALNLASNQGQTVQGRLRVLLGTIRLYCALNSDDSRQRADEEAAQALALLQDQAPDALAPVYALMAQIKEKNLAVQIRDKKVLEIQDDACQALQFNADLPDPHQTLGRLYADYGLMDAAHSEFQAYGQRAFFAWQRYDAIRLRLLRWHWPNRVQGDPPAGLGQSLRSC